MYIYMYIQYCILHVHVHRYRTPLMLAVTNGNSELAQVLVDHDAQVDCTDKHLRTALHRAVSNSFYITCYSHTYICSRKLGNSL